MGDFYGGIPDIFIYRGNRQLLGAIGCGPALLLRSDGLAWSPDGTRLFALAAVPGASTPLLLAVFRVVVPS